MEIIIKPTEADVASLAADIFVQYLNRESVTLGWPRVPRRWRCIRS